MTPSDILALYVACNTAMDAGLCPAPPAAPSKHPVELIAGVGPVSSAEAYRVRSMGYKRLPNGEWAMCAAIAYECREATLDACKVLKSDAKAWRQVPPLPRGR